MALTDRNIIITPNRGQATEPIIQYIGADASNSATITLRVLNTGAIGMLRWESTARNLLSLTDTSTTVLHVLGNGSATSTATGSVVVAGGMGIAENLYIGGLTRVTSTTAATSAATGALQVAGGVGVTKDLYVGGTIYGIASVTGTISTATNIAGGAVRQIVYQTGVGTTGFITAPVTAGHVLTWNGGSFVWAATSTVATQVNTVLRTTNANHYVTFVDSNNATATAESVYTSVDLYHNPSTGTFNAPTFNATSVTNGGFQGIDADTAAIPSFTWSADLNTGMWHPAADTVAFTTGGTERLRITSTGGISFGATGTAYGTSGQILQSNGNASPTWVNASGIGAGTAQDATYLVTFDDRTKAPSDDAAGRVRFGFTSLANNNTAPYADYLHLRSYTDASGGSDNLVMFNKSSIGMRIWQQSWGSATAYSSYKDVALETNNVTFNSLGIGTAASGTAGEIRASNEITAYYSSDIRLKENIRLIADPIGIINQIRGVYYDWTDEHIKARGGEDGYFVRKHDIGVIAQEVEKVLPEIVAERDDGTKVVKYEKIVALLIEAVKSQQQQINQILEQVENLANK